MTQYALTAEGQVATEPTPLEALQVGDTVLGLPDPENRDAPRSVWVVTESLGMHYVPAEDPTRAEQFLINIGLQRAVAGPRVEGILVKGLYGPGLFALESTPVLERVV